MPFLALQPSSESLEFECSPATVAHEPPPARPTEFGAESIQPETLVHHREAIEAGVTLEEAQRVFRIRRVEFMAVIRQGQVIGLCARGQVGFVMSSRFGFALYSHQPVETVMVERPMLIEKGTPIRTLLDRALARVGEAFHEDVVLIDTDRRLLGLIKVETLAQHQSRLVAEQLMELRCQHELQRRQNLELFRANHAARQSTGLYVSLFGNHALGVALLDSRGVIHEHNRRLGELLNCADTPLAGTSLTVWIAEKDRPGFLALFDAHLRGNTRAAAQEFAVEVPPRGTRLFRCSTGWIRETSQICACLEDVTEQRTLERSALRQEKQTLLDTLVGGIAHELNNKLTPVIGYSELLCLEAGGRRDYVDVITKSVGEAARIVQQLLELSKPPSHAPEVLDLRTVLEETLVMLKFQLRESGCQVLTLLPATPVWVEADGGHLRQVALNLIINALHALEGRSDPLLTLEVRRVAARAELVVLDNGCGISRENLGRIFDPFFTTKGPERGTGLGLSICSSLVRQNGGEIGVESAKDMGARFSVTLPARDGVAAGLSPAPAAPAANLLSAVARGRRVLVIEDELVLRRLMQEVLCAQFGCLVDLATNGAEALSLLGQTDYALILSDVRMPEMNGVEFFMHLREIRPDLAARLAFVTGYPADKHLVAAIRQWDVPVLAKPFTMARLSDVCRPILQENATRSAA